ELLINIQDGNATKNGVINIPEGTALGDYRFRLRSRFSTSDPGPCEDITFGDTRDYTLSVISPPTCLPVTLLNASNVTANSANLSWVSAGTLFDIEWGVSGFTPTGNPNDASTTGIGNPFTLSGLNS